MDARLPGGGPPYSAGHFPGAVFVDGLPLEAETPTIEPTVFTPEVQPAWRVVMADVRAAIDDLGVSLLDALPPEYYTTGHIPTAISLQAEALLDEAGTVKGAEDLSAMPIASGLDPAQPDSTCCGGGYYGAFAAFVLDLMGFENVSLYDGAFEGWTGDPSNPVERAP